MWVSEAAKAHYRELAQVEMVMLDASRKVAKSVEPGFFVDSWKAQIKSFYPLLAAAQTNVASKALDYTGTALAQQDLIVAPDWWVDPESLAGVNPRGGNLGRQLMVPAYNAEDALRVGRDVPQVVRAAEEELQAIVISVLQDTARITAGMDTAARPGVGYVRVVHPGACPRCVVLAGRFYRWNAGFLRHPNCRCVHEPCTAKTSGGMFDDPYEAFNSLSEAEQNSRWGKHNAEAIREGADIFQVTNARRGLTPNRMFTTEGMSKRGYARSGLNRGQRRMTPEAIYKQAAGSRLKARALLEEHGYILPGGQNPLGSIRGQREGFGALGRGGSRRAASDAVLEARHTGIRDPRSRYTMTAAERSLYDVEQRYQMALQGFSPYRSGGFGNTPDPSGLGLNTVGGPGLRKITPKEFNQVTLEYRSVLKRIGPR